jgi:predicted amidohydrolase YtcJ
MLSIARHRTLSFVGSILLAAMTLGCRGSQPAQLTSYPDLILANGRILTVDQNFSITEALAIRDGRILATGSNDDIESLAGPNTQRRDLGGRTVIPGIIDTHAHLQDMALNEFAADVAAIEPKYRDFSMPPAVQGRTVEELLQNIGQIVAARPRGSWVRVTLADPQTMGPPFYEQVRRQQLDAISPNNPLAVKVHGILDLIDTEIIDQLRAYFGYLPAEAEHDQTGTLSGRVDTTIMRSIIGDLLIERPFDSLYTAYRKELQLWASYGVTTWSSGITPLRALSVFREMERRGELPIRSALTHSVGVAVYPDAGEFYKRLGDITNMGTDMLWYPGIGVVNVDGSFESTCTTLNPKNPCLIARPDDVKRRALFEGIKAGNRVTGTHTGGDLAVDHMLDVIEEASKAAGMTLEQIRAKRHTIDHCTFSPRADQIERAKGLNILWSCGANFIETDAADAEKWYGAKYANAWVVPAGSILKANGRLAGHGEACRMATISTTLRCSSHARIARAASGACRKQSTARRFSGCTRSGQPTM